MSGQPPAPSTSQPKSLSISLNNISKSFINKEPGIEMTFGNIFQLISSLSPLLLSAFLIISSISNGDLKWLMYLAGFVLLLFLFSIAAFTTNATFDKDSAYYKRECNFVQLPFGLSRFTIPNFNSTALGFIFAYIFMPMVQYDSYNIVFLSIIIVFFFIDGFSKVMHGCTPVVGVLVGLAIGWIIGYLWYLLVSVTNKNLVFFNTDSNTSICSRPSNQTFKCKVYKNGEIIHTM